MDWTKNKYSVGNLQNANIEEIWNSPKAIKIREHILKNDYSLCDFEKCPFVRCRCFDRLLISQENCKPVMELSPTMVKFGHDHECNIACNICRDELIVNTRKELETKDRLIDSLFIPALKNTKYVCISGSGDAFGSRHSRKLIKRISNTYPDIKYDFLTNGLMCNEKVLNDLNVRNKIFKMRISLHATTKETYGKVVKNGERLFDTIIKNLYMLKDIKKEYGFEYYIQMVVSADNYKEMPEFAEFVHNFDAEASFWEYRPASKGFSQSDKNLYHREIVNPQHPNYSDFIEVIKDPRLQKVHDGMMSPLFNRLRKS